jgi:hypothetical protein
VVGDGLGESREFSEAEVELVEDGEGHVCVRVERRGADGKWRGADGIGVSIR